MTMLSTAIHQNEGRPEAAGVDDWMHQIGYTINKMSSYEVWQLNVGARVFCALPEPCIQFAVVSSVAVISSPG